MASLAPPRPAAAGAAGSAAALTTECRCVGSPANENITGLLVLLRGICYKAGSFMYHDTVMRAPLQGGTTSTTIRLTRSGAAAADTQPKNFFAEVLPDRWTVRVESLPLRQVRRDGSGGAEAQVSVHEVLESGCYSGLTQQFFEAMGAKVDYEAVRKGNEYHCLYEDREILVHLVMVFPVQQAGRSQPATPARYVVDVMLRVHEDERAEGQRVLESFAAHLAQHVVLGRAEVGFT